MHRQIRTSIGVLMFITVPASIGIMALAQPLFTVFYGYDPIVHGHDPNFDGSRLLFYYARSDINFTIKCNCFYVARY